MDGAELVSLINLTRWYSSHKFNIQQPDLSIHIQQPDLSIHCLVSHACVVEPIVNRNITFTETRDRVLLQAHCFNAVVSHRHI